MKIVQLKKKDIKEEEYDYRTKSFGNVSVLTNLYQRYLDENINIYSRKDIPFVHSGR